MADDLQLSAELSAAMSSFERAAGWSDMVASLERVLAALRSYPAASRVPHSLTLAKRLAQCTSAALPVSVHLKALEVYGAVLGRLGAAELCADLALWSMGLFAMFAVIGAEARPRLLKLVGEQLLPLGRRLAPCLPGLLVALLPGAAADCAELLDALRAALGERPFFFGIWRAAQLSRAPGVRAGALAYATTHLPAELSAREHAAEYLPSDAIVAASIVACAGDADPAVRRAAVDLLVARFPLQTLGELFSAPGATQQLVGAAMRLMGADDAECRDKVVVWLAGDDALHVHTPALPILLPALVELLTSPAENQYAARASYQILRGVLLDELLRGAVVAAAAPALVRAAMLEARAKDKFHRIVEELLSAPVVWGSLRAWFASTDRLGDADALQVLLFALDFLPVDAPETLEQHLPALFAEAVRRLRVAADGDVLLQVAPGLLELCESLIAAGISLTQSLAYEYCECFPLLLRRWGSDAPMPETAGSLLVSVVSAGLASNVQTTDSTATQSARDFVAAWADTADISRSEQLLLEQQALRLEASLPAWAVACVRCAAAAQPQACSFGLGVLISLASVETVSSILHSRVHADVLARRAWQFLEAEHGVPAHRIALLWLQLQQIIPAACSATMTDAIIHEEQLPERVRHMRRFSFLWLGTDTGGAQVLPVGLFSMLDALSDPMPTVRSAARAWLGAAMTALTQVIDPVLIQLMHPATARNEQFLYVHQFDARRILYFFETATKLCNSEGVIDVIFQLAASELILERWSGLEGAPQAPMTYFDLMVDVSLRFVQSAAAPSSSKSVVAVTAMVRTAAAEFLLLLLPRGGSATAVRVVDPMIPLLGECVSENDHYMQTVVLSVFEASLLPYVGGSSSRSYSFSEVMLRGLGQPAVADLLSDWVAFVAECLPHMGNVPALINKLAVVLCELITAESAASQSASASLLILLEGLTKVTKCWLKPIPKAAASPHPDPPPDSAAQGAGWGFGAVGGMLTAATGMFTPEANAGPHEAHSHAMDAVQSRRAIFGAANLAWASSSGQQDVRDCALRLVRALLDGDGARGILLWWCISANRAARGACVEMLQGVADASPVLFVNCVRSVLAGRYAPSKVTAAATSEQPQSLESLPIHVLEGAAMSLLLQLFARFDDGDALTQSWPALHDTCHQALTQSQSPELAIPSCLYVLRLLECFVRSSPPLAEAGARKALQDLATRVVAQCVAIAQSQAQVSASDLASASARSEMVIDLLGEEGAVLLAEELRGGHSDILSARRSLAAVCLRLMSQLLCPLLGLVWAQTKADRETLLPTALGAIVPAVVSLLCDDKTAPSLLYNAAAVVASFSASSAMLAPWTKDVLGLIGRADFFSAEARTLRELQVAMGAVFSDGRESLQGCVERTSGSVAFAPLLSRDSELDCARALKRLAFVLLSGPVDHHQGSLTLILEKLVGGLKLTLRPVERRRAAATVLLRAAFLTMRVLALRFSSDTLGLFLPIILAELIRVIGQPDEHEPAAVSAALEAAELLLVLRPEQFEPSRWMFLADAEADPLDEEEGAYVPFLLRPVLGVGPQRLAAIREGRGGAEQEAAVLHAFCE